MELGIGNSNRRGIALPAPSPTCGKHLLKQTLSLALAFLGEDDRLRLANRIGDHPLVVQSVHRVPVKRLPHPRAVVQAKQQKCENGRILEYKVDLKVAFGIERTSPP